jgi:DNA-binding NarL/FixJ family response regulator
LFGARVAACIGGRKTRGQALMDEPTEQNRIRLMLVDEQALFRASLSRFLAAQPDLEVAGDCGTSAEALEVLKGSTVDVVLVDFDADSEHGTDFISAARQAGYQGRFLVVAGSPDVRNSAMALKFGASGIFLKSETPDHLLQAIKLVGSGGIWIDRTIIQLLADQLIDRGNRAAVHKFSDSLEKDEHDVLLGILGGLTNRKIGDSMGLTESNVKNIVQRLFNRAGVRTRGQLVRAALEGSLGAAHELFKRQPHHLPNGRH